ncbi:MAG: ABC transporter permease, partial [Planctomycetota bacterium]
MNVPTANKKTKTNWDIVVGQFRKHRTAMMGLWVLALLFLLAIFAPVLATSSPFYRSPVVQIDPVTGASGAAGFDLPWFRDLLDQNVFPSGVDLFFNLLLLASPFFVLVALLLRRYSARARFLACALPFLYGFFIVAGPERVVTSEFGRLAFYPQRWLRYQLPKRSYLEERKPELQRVLAEQRIASTTERLAALRERKVEVEAALAQAPEDSGVRANLDAEARAIDADLVRVDRQLASWHQKHEAAQEALKLSPYTFVLAPVAFHHDDNDNERIVEAPSFGGWGNLHPLGTDKNGRDVFARIIYGTRVSLTIGVIAVVIYCTIGTILGALMGFFGGWVDMTLMRLVEIMICFPVFAFVLIVVAVLETKNIFVVMVAIGLVSWTSVARLIRGQFLAERGQEYVLAARAMGVPRWRIVFQHVLPNAIHPMFVAATFGVASAILLESGLAFLGLGDPNVPSWGQLLLQGRQTKKI